MATSNAQAEASANSSSQSVTFDASRTNTDENSIKNCVRGKEYVERVRGRVPGFNRWVCAPNFTSPKGYNCVPNGGVALYNADMGMSVDFLDGVTDFAGTSLYAIKGGMEDWCIPDSIESCAKGGAIENHIRHLDEYYEGFSGNGPRLECMKSEAHVSLSDGKNKPWLAVLDSPDSFVGLYAMSIRPTLGAAEETYVIVVGNVGAGSATEDMYNLAETYAEEGKSFREFVETPQYKYTERLAQRNRNRIAAEFAEAAGLTLGTIADLFSSEKLARDEARLRHGELENRRDPEKYKQGKLRKTDYLEVAELLSATSQDKMLEGVDLLKRWGVEVTSAMLKVISGDPHGLSANNPYLDLQPQSATAETELPTVPLIADPFSETLNNQILIAGRSALLYRGCVPQHKIGDGQGVLMTMSPCEGLTVIHGNDRRECTKCPFGNGDPQAGAFDITPTCAGKVKSASEVSWRQCVAAASTNCPGFLRWRSKRTAEYSGVHPTGSLDSVVPHVLALTGADHCIFRAVNSEFETNMHAMSTKTLRLQGSTRLDPLTVVLAPQPLREFPGRKIPTQ